MPGAGEGRWPGKAIASPGDGAPSPPGSRPPSFRDPPHLTVLRLGHERRMIHKASTLKVGSLEGEAAAVVFARGEPEKVAALARRPRIDSHTRERRTTLNIRTPNGEREEEVR